MDVRIASRVPPGSYVPVRYPDARYSVQAGPRDYGDRFARQDRELVRQPGSSSRSGQRRGVSGWRGWYHLAPQHAAQSHTRAIAATSGPCLLKSSAGRCVVYRRNAMFCTHTTSMKRSPQSCQTGAGRLVRDRGRPEPSIKRCMPHISSARCRRFPDRVGSPGIVTDLYTMLIEAVQQPRRRIS